MLEDKIKQLLPNLNIKVKANDTRIVIDLGETELFYYNRVHHITRINSIETDTALKIKQLYLQNYDQPTFNNPTLNG